MKLELHDIHKSFDQKKVLSGISLVADGGKAFGLLGRNGAGKTTTIRILMGVFSSDVGQVLIDGKPIDYDKIRIGYLPEERGLYQKKKIIDQLIYFAQLKGMKRPDAIKSVDYWLKRLDMAEYRNKRLDTLSKGNQQKIQLITTLAHNPEIIVLDEPFSGIDPVNAKLLKDVVQEEIEKDKIVLFSSHQMNYIEEFCDNIAILNGGRIVLNGELRKIKKHYFQDKIVVRSCGIDKILSEFGGLAKNINKDEIIIQLTDPCEKKQTMQKLVSEYDIDEIKVFEPSLNDIFVEYTKDGI